VDNDRNDQDLVSALYVTEGPTALARHGQSGRKGGATVRRVALLVLGLACVVAIAVAAHPAPRDPIYSVDQVYGGLWAHPSAWSGGRCACAASRSARATTEVICGAAPLNDLAIGDAGR
jgi:hypothetical protein